MRYLTGGLSRPAYLARFDTGEAGKFSPVAIDRLVEHARLVTTPGPENILVFGFAAGAVLMQTNRPSASRFFWSRPVVLEFAADHPGYGSAGLLADLQVHRPAIVALQKHDWGLAEATTQDSITFFMNHPALRSWLEAGYVPITRMPRLLCGGEKPDVSRRQFIAIALLIVALGGVLRAMWLRAIRRRRPSASSGTTKARGCTTRATARCGASGRPIAGTRCSRAGLHRAGVCGLPHVGVGTWQARVVPVASGLLRSPRSWSGSRRPRTTGGRADRRCAARHEYTSSCGIARRSWNRR